MNSCMELCIWNCVYEIMCMKLCMDLCVWICVYGFVCMDFCVWICVYELVCMCTRAWTFGLKHGAGGEGVEDCEGGKREVKGLEWLVGGVAGGRGYI